MSICVIKKCSGKAIAKRLCWKHYRRLQRSKTIQKIFNKEKTCKAKDCNLPVVAKDLCMKHYARQSRHGDYKIVKYKRAKA